ncbi:hypothetical protein ACFQ6Q_00690 [Streptomyces sp. NPDC056437]|uniref:hypothetical protein n=1 Tax=Streptomyces sp. NPDC056437 TaxID=3345816 RepID=UPI003696C8BA
MSLRLRLIVNADLDAYEAAEAARIRREAEAAEVSREARLELEAYYEIAVHSGDELDIRRIEALLADIDFHKPGEPSLLDAIRGRHPRAA